MTTTSERSWQSVVDEAEAAYDTEDGQECYEFSNGRRFYNRAKETYDDITGD